MARQEGQTDFFKFVGIAVGIGADETLVVAMLVLVQAAVDVGSANVEKVRPQPADGVFGDIRSQLRAGSAEQENADDFVAFPHPEGHRLGPNGASAFVVPELGG